MDKRLGHSSPALIPASFLFPLVLSACQMCLPDSWQVSLALFHPCFFSGRKRPPIHGKATVVNLSPGPSFKVAAGGPGLMAEGSGSRDEGHSGPGSIVRPRGCWSHRLLTHESQMLHFQKCGLLVKHSYCVETYILTVK